MRKYALLGTLLCASLITACGGGETSTTRGGTTTSEGGGGTGGTDTGGSGGSTTTSDTGGGGTGGTGGSENCVALTVSPLKVNSFGSVSAPAMVLGPDADRFDIQFYELNDVQTPGTFDLATAPDDNYASCDRCVLVYADLDVDGAPTKVFYQESGSITIDTISSPPGPLSSGSLSAVKLIEVTIDPDTFESTPVAGGECLFLNSLTWDTTPVNGTDCTSAEDCNNTLLQVCDVTTQKCVDGQCDGDTLMCGAGDSCLGQVDSPSVGACYDACTPYTAGACPAGFECVNTGFDGTSGLCYQTGAGATGAACLASDTGTSCVAGDNCATNANGDSVCQQQCTIFKAAPGCPANADCTYSGLCAGAGGTNPAAIGATCAGADAAFGVACGPSAGAFRGLCYNEDDADPLLCGKLCRLAAGFESDCAAAEFCYDTLGVEVGVCYKDPTCANNVVEPGEPCDDGNMVSGDGCSATCQVEPAFYCTTALPAVLGANMGNTTGGTAIFASACNVGTTHVEKIYTYTPLTSGTLTLVLASATDQGIYVRTTCLDAMTEVGCADAVPGDRNETLDVPVVAGMPITIFVDGFSDPAQAGPFTLTLTQN